MIRKLKVRFILMAMLSMLLVLMVIIGGMNILNYRSVIREADQTLDELAKNGGVFPEREMNGVSFAPDDRDKPEGGQPGDQTGGKPDGDQPGEKPDGARPDGDKPDGEKPDDGMRDGNRLNDDKNDNGRGEKAFSSRYFSVLFDADKNITETDILSIYTVSESEAQEMAKNIMSSSKTKGFVGDYRYLVSAEDDGQRVIFLECGRSLSDFRSFRDTSLLISSAGLVIVFLLICLLSNIITKPAVESYEKQKRFITDAGHEIKTPLAIINADTDVIETLMGEDIEWTEDIKKQIKNLTALTNDLVFLSRMDEANKGLVKEEVDLSSLVKDMAESFRSRALSSEKELTVTIRDGIKLVSNKNSITHICSILLDNAMKYSPEKGVVKVELKSGNRSALLSVSNTIKDKLTEEDTKLLFDRFYRADSSRNSETGGHGLGLSIAKAETEALGGKISASLEGDSLVMSVVLPSM